MLEKHVEMDSIRLHNAFALIDNAITNELIPGAVVHIRCGGRSFEYASGNAIVTDTDMLPVTIDTLYDCASLTKVVATLPLTLMLVEAGDLRLDDLVASYIPEFHDYGKEMITIRHLLAHTSGLPAHRDLYSQGWSQDKIAQALNRMKLEYRPGKGCQYSCLGYIVLGRIIEHVCGQSLAHAVEQMLLKPLGMTDSCYNPPQEKRLRIAATEYDARLGAYCWGRVHDENAAALGGIAGNAGLFTTARDLARYASLWLRRAEHRYGTQLLSDSIMQDALGCQTTAIPGAKRGLGWVLRGDIADFAGKGWSLRGFGHTGFTGTSIWIDPEWDTSIVLLTNRVHFGREKSVVELRQQFHEAVFEAIDRKS
ncbi:serine hydrolase domain-containing protein [Paenibacillus alvei]|uniref:serine hydrolase domain-containing protein n=1 Tax=Paenibacillus alvei TaxID=44250 RepID=UPI0018CD73F2|nr:serine hydrolase domain-containing protein [Paenibacillus alvei]MCY9578884.1 beta-lactamase family protein [Paenibacillus alvei]MCY9583940.1 beta-lactamase family protein [Paenibacillus alvei]